MTLVWGLQKIFHHVPPCWWCMWVTHPFWPCKELGLHRWWPWGAVAPTACSGLWPMRTSSVTGKTQRWGTHTLLPLCGSGMHRCGPACSSHQARPRLLPVWRTPCFCRGEWSIAGKAPPSSPSSELIREWGTGLLGLNFPGTWCVLPVYTVKYDRHRSSLRVRHAKCSSYLTFFFPWCSEISTWKQSL